MLNKYIAIGNLTADPELNEFKSGKKKCTFAIAVNLGKDITFVDVECWDRVAENCKKILSKGTQVFVDGKLKYNSWKTKQGHSRNKLICSADFVKSMSKLEKTNRKEVITSKEVNDLYEEEYNEEIKKDLEEIPF